MESKMKTHYTYELKIKFNFYRIGILLFFAILCSAIIVGWCIPGISRVEGNGIFIQLEYIITHCSSYHDLTKHFIIKTICVNQNE